MCCDTWSLKLADSSNARTSTSYHSGGAEGESQGGDPYYGGQDVDRIGLGQSTAQTWTDREYV